MGENIELRRGRANSEKPYVTGCANKNGEFFLPCNKCPCWTMNKDKFATDVCKAILSGVRPFFVMTAGEAMEKLKGVRING